MTDSHTPSFSAGTVDLSVVAGAGAAPAGTPPVVTPASTPAVPAEVIEVTELNLQTVVERSLQQPVFVLLCSRLAPGCQDLAVRVERLAGELGGLLVATVDVDAQPRVAQAFQVQAVPAMLALLGGRPAPLFQGAPDDEQLRSVFTQVLEIAVEAGLGTPAGEAVGQEVQAETPLPPWHQEAYDAIERGDFDAAIAAYDQALKENPKDADARAGKAQVSLLARTQDADPAQVRAAAAASAADVEAQLAVADLDVLGGAVEDAFVRLLDTFRAAPVEERDPLRLRLLDLFEVVGLTDPRVIAARKALASALN